MNIVLENVLDADEWLKIMKKNSLSLITLFRH